MPLKPGFVVDDDIPLDLQIMEHLLPDPLEILGYNPRQITALKHPIDRPDFGVVTKLHHGHPMFRQIFPFNNEDKTELDTIVSNSFSGDLKKRALKVYQMSTILTVEDRPLVWHASFAWLYNPDDEIQQRRQWRAWQNDKVAAMLRYLIPHSDKRKMFLEKFDPFATSFHIRSYLTPEELMAISAAKSRLFLPELDFS